MKNKSRLFGIYLPVFLLLLIASVTLRTVALILHFDATTFYFDEKSVITAADIIVISGAVFMFTYIFAAKKNMKLIPSFTTPATYIPTGIVSITLIFVIKSLIDKAAAVKENMDYLKMLATPSAKASLSTETIIFFILVASIVFATFSIAHFALTAIDERQSSTKRASFGICTVIFLAAYATYLYFNKDLPLNAPNKIVDQMAYLFSALFFLYETRLSLGRERWKSYIAFGFIASLISAYASIPSTIYYFVTGEFTSNSIYETALTLSIFIFITARLFLTSELIEDTPSDTVTSLIKFAEARDAEVNPQKPEIVDVTGEDITDEDENDGNQITFEYFENENLEPTAIFDSDTLNDNEEQDLQNNDKASETE